MSKGEITEARFRKENSKMLLIQSKFYVFAM